MATIDGTSDISVYVAQLIDLERQSGPAKVYKEDKEILTKRSATLTDLRLNLGALNTQVQALMQPGTLSPFGAKAVASSLGTVATGTASTAALTGTHSLLVTQLAKRSTVVSSQWTLTGTNIASSVGAGSQTFRISVNGVNTDVSVSVGVTDDNKTVLTAMAAAINASEAKVTASVVNDSGSTARLVLASDESGSANVVSLADQSGTLVGATGTASGAQSSGTAGGFLYASDQLDARFVLDGLTISRGKNTIDDVLTGVTVTLTATQAADATPVTLTVGPDQKAIQDKVQAFLDAYNTTVKFLKERTSVSVSTETAASGSTEVTSVTRGTLASESTYLGLLINLRAEVGGRVTTGAANGPVALSEIGITAGKDGTLSISDTTKFAKALTDNPDGVTTLFNSSNGIATRVSARLNGFVTTGGTLDNALAATTSRLESVNRAIKQQEAYLKVKQATLLKQYTTLQETLLQLQSQQSMIESMTTLVTY
jgi:flagellar hook-associated protein 2